MSDGFPEFLVPRAVDDRHAWTATVDSFDQYRDNLYYVMRLHEPGQATHTFIALVNPADEASIERELHAIATTGHTNTEYAGYALHAPTCGGWLVGMDAPLPLDAATFAMPGEPVRGCNQLRCKRCGVYVRILDQLFVHDLPLSESEAAQLFGRTDPQTGAWSSTYFAGRGYVCRCNYEQVSSPRSAATVEGTEWFCAGHLQP